MTKKDYVLIASNFEACVGRIFRTRNDGGQIIDSVIWGLASNIADDLQKDNPKFDRQKFMQACGLKAV